MAITKFRLAIIVFLTLTCLPLVSGTNKPRISAPDNFETRCGWFYNPTPANMSLFDRDDEWIIGIQGDYQVEKDWEFSPDFKPGQWVRTNVHYGYGCACMDLKVNKENKTVVEIKAARGRALSACRNDEALKKWKKMFR